MNLIETKKKMEIYKKYEYDPPFLFKPETRQYFTMVLCD